MAILRSWFNGTKDFDVPYIELDDALGRARELIGGCPSRFNLKLEIELDTGAVLQMDEIVGMLQERADELKGRPRVR